MPDPFEEPKKMRDFERVAERLKASKPYISRTILFAFVCGGHEKDKDAIRSQFLRWLPLNAPNVIALVSEAAFGAHGADGFINLSRFEKVISECADVVIIFPESVGSYAETGLFSGHPPTSKKCLVANVAEHHADDSFLNNGPIDQITKDSRFKPTIVLQRDDLDTGFRQIKLRIERGRLKKERFELTRLEKMPGLARLGLIQYIASLLPQPKPIEIKKALTAIGATQNKSTFDDLLAIGCAAGLLKASDEHVEAISTAPQLVAFEGIERESERLSLLLGAEDLQAQGVKHDVAD